MNKSNEPVDFEAEILHVTDDAYLITTDDEFEIWLPKSQMEIEEETEVKIKFSIPQWLAEEKGLV